MLVTVERRNVLLGAFDLPPPPPLLAKRPIGCVAGVALVLTHARTSASIGRIEWAQTHDRPTPASTPALEELRRSNPATAALPLLELLARAQSGRVALPRAESAVLTLDVSIDAR
jgi:hypothetical protein